MQITTNATVTYSVAKVSIHLISVMPTPTGIIFRAGVTWLDSANKVLRQADQQYTQAELIAVAGAKAPQVTTYLAALNSLMPAGATPVIRIQIDNQNTVKVQTFCIVTTGTPPVKTTQMTVLTEAQLVAAGLSSAIVTGLVAEIAGTLTA